MGHAGFLAGVQKENVDFLIHSLPVIKGMATLDKVVRNF
jgi:hypothetical protein